MASINEGVQEKCSFVFQIKNVALIKKFINFQPTVSPSTLLDLNCLMLSFYFEVCSRYPEVGEFTDNYKYPLLDMEYMSSNFHGKEY